MLWVACTRGLQSHACIPFSILNMLMADETERAKILSGKGEFHVKRILFRMPELDIVRKSQRASQDGEAYQSKTAP